MFVSLTQIPLRCKSSYMLLCSLHFTKTADSEDVTSRSERLRLATHEITAHCPWNYVSPNASFLCFFPKIFIWKIWSCRNYFVTLQYQNIPAKLKETWAQVRRRSNYTISYKIHPSSQLLPKKKDEQPMKTPDSFRRFDAPKSEKEEWRRKKEEWNVKNCK